MNRDPIPVHNLLQAEGFADMRVQLDLQARLLRIVRQALPEILRHHCLHCVPKDESLVLYADNPAWAYQLRFYGQHLRRALEDATGTNYSEIVVHNLMPSRPAELPHAHPNLPSAAMVDHIKSCAGSASCPELREAWERLGRTLEEARRKRENDGN